MPEPHPPTRDHRVQAHPWHGVGLGSGAPALCLCFIEMVPTDTAKYEVDKATGLLRLDRPQRYSSQPPSLYGFLPQTYCGPRVAARTGRTDVAGDGDPMDVCVLTERPILHGGVLVEARPIGGLRMLDGQQADDKVIAVLSGDPAYGTWRRLADLPPPLLDRLQHYFLTYKALPQAPAPPVEIVEVYDVEEAHATIRASIEDYRAAFPT